MVNEAAPWRILAPIAATRLGVKGSYIINNLINQTESTNDIIFSCFFYSIDFYEMASDPF